MTAPPSRHVYPRALDLYTPRGCGQAAGGPQGATAGRIPPTPAPLTVWYYIHYLLIHCTHTHISINANERAAETKIQEGGCQLVGPHCHTWALCLRP